MLRNSSLWIGGACIALVLVVAGIGLVWTPFSPTANGPEPLLGPSWPHVLGTDAYGTDVLSRLMAGAKIVILVGVLSVVGTPMCSTDSPRCCSQFCSPPRWAAPRGRP